MCESYWSLSENNNFIDFSIVVIETVNCISLSFVQNTVDEIKFLERGVLWTIRGFLDISSTLYRDKIFWFVKTKGMGEKGSIVKIIS